MKKHLCVKLIIAVFLVGSVSLFVWFSMKRPKILILHSYDPAYSWVKDVNVGIRRVFEKHTDYVLRWYYLDTKRHPWPEFKAHAGDSARHTIEKMQPDIIIAIDDDAQEHVSKYYINHPHIRIVFAGVNNDPETYGFEKATNVTGILERIPLAALKETLTLLSARDQRQLKVRFLGDHSETVVGDERYFSQFDWHPIQALPSRLVDTLPQWQEAVESAKAEGVDYIIVSNYRKITRSTTDQTLVPPDELIGWTEKHSPVPIIGTNEFFAAENGALAIGTSPYEQGEVAAQIAEMMLNGREPRQIPFHTSRQFVVAMRAQALQLRDMRLPQAYEAAARIGGLYFQ